MMAAVTVGTAGHIDHGKSALVRALTGVDPDRLAEEQRRGMTLDLGFAHLDLPSGRRIGIVDVPGHEALIHNMLAGAGGIDLVMLVVAADEGAMPQTREHLDIARFLRIAGGVIVLSKVDLVKDAEWLAAVEEDLAALVAGSPLQGAPVVRVSSKTGEGLPQLLVALDRLAAAVPARPTGGPVRLPVDRSFTMQGFGTVVTGTLWSGTVHPGDQLVILPQARDVRVRGVQVHGDAVGEAHAGSRVAVNLAGVEKDDVRRGDVLATPGAYRPTDRLDVRLKLLPSAPPLRSGARLHVHLGSGAVVGRVRFSETPQLEPGAEVLAHLKLEAPVLAVHGDRFVVRRYSPTQTMGGGIVLNASSIRRRRTQAAAGLQAVGASGPEALVVAAVAATGSAGMIAADAAAAAGVDAATASAAVASAVASGLLVERSDRLFARSVLDDVRRRVQEVLQEHHRRAPWRRGLPREELKSRVASGAGDRLFDRAVADLLAERHLTNRASLLALAGFEPTVPDGDRRTRDAIMQALLRGGVSPPSLGDLRRLAAPDAVDRMLQALADDGLIVAVSADLRFAAPAVEQVRRIVVDTLRGGGEITVAMLRDRLQTSRRFALALLEFFDTARVTRRVGDRRVLGPQADTPFALDA